MRIVATSDCHGYLPEVELPTGDVLVVAGDVLPNIPRDELAEKHRLQLAKLQGSKLRRAIQAIDAERQVLILKNLDDWFATLPFKKIIFVAGNHDWCFELRGGAARAILKHAIYLEDEGCEIDGVTFYGSPWQPEFYAWAFNLPRDGTKLRRLWDKIPAKLDVLITHGPPYKILDSSPEVDCFDQGDKLLLERVRVVKPKFHVFGHIHGGYGRVRIDETEFLNVSLCNEQYIPVQPPLVFDV